MTKNTFLAEVTFKDKLQSIDLATALANNNNDVNQSLENFFNINNSLLDRYAPLKQVTKKDMKTQSKPWITKGILTSIIRKKDKKIKYIVNHLKQRIKQGKKHSTKNTKFTKIFLQT